MGPEIFLLGEPGQFARYAQAVAAAGGRVRRGTNAAAAWGCRGLVLPGGGDLEPWRYGQENTACQGLEPWRDELELALLDRFTSLALPVLGICRGMQTVNVFFGGTLCQDLPGHRACQGTDRLHRVCGVGAMGGLWGRETVANSAHHQAVDRLGAGLQAVQWAPDGTVEALCHRKAPVWGVQWHPERLHLQGAAEGARLFDAFLALVGPG